MQPEMKRIQIINVTKTSAWYNDRKELSTVTFLIPPVSGPHHGAYISSDLYFDPNTPLPYPPSLRPSPDPIFICKFSYKNLPHPEESDAKTS